MLYNDLDSSIEYRASSSVDTLLDLIRQMSASVLYLSGESVEDARSKSLIIHTLLKNRLKNYHEPQGDSV